MLSTKLPVDVIDSSLRPYLTNLHFPQPGIMKDQQGYWAPVDGPLFGPNGVNIQHDLQQGGDGDCWFLSSLAAISERDPSFFQNHIKQNPDGTYTVTFYKDVNILGFTQTIPVQITVDNQLPHDQNGNLLYAQTPDNVMWVAIYEKAYTEFRGGSYNDINGGWGDVGMHDLTGLPTNRNDVGSPDSSLAEIDAAIKSGRAVTTGTTEPPNQGQWWVDPNQQIVGGHEYSVERVDMNAHPPTITLLNPWGSGSAAPQEITITEADWKKYFRDLEFTSVRP
jgi:hypothetical protein